MTNFFEQQDRARRNSGLIVLLFLASVVVVLAFTNLLAVLAHWVITKPSLPLSQFVLHTPAWVYVCGTAFALVVIAFGTWARMSVLADGGPGLARMIGARRVNRTARDPASRQLLNVVEELAIAAGINVPEVFVLDNEGAINALAAGHAPNEAVVIVTRGALQRLSRSEMQGMMAHEFSHILNGDILVNLRVVGIIAGVTVLGGIGRAYTLGSPMFFPVAAPLWLIGSVGALAGQCVRSVLSRQREFLADAASVQFTRDPMGIAGALVRMQRHGATVAERHSAELEHMYLGEPRRFMFPWLSSHPSVERRLERLLGPRWRGLVHDAMRREPAPASRAPGAAAAAPASVRTTAQALLGTIGQPSHAHLVLARELLARLDPEIRELAGTAPGASAVLYALFLSNKDTRQLRLEVLGAGAGTAVPAESGRIAAILDKMDPRLRIPLFEMAVPVLREETPAAREALLENAVKLVASGKSASLRDFVLLTLCRRHFGAHRPGPMPEKYRSIVPVAGHAVAVLSLMAHCAQSGEGAFHRAMVLLGLTRQRLTPVMALGFPVVETALYELKLLAAPYKANFVRACVGVAFTDQTLSVAEGELLRAICASIDSPLPPLVAEATIDVRPGVQAQVAR